MKVEYSFALALQNAGIKKDIIEKILRDVGTTEEEVYSKFVALGHDLSRMAVASGLNESLLRKIIEISQDALGPKKKAELEREAENIPIIDMPMGLNPPKEENKKKEDI